MTYFIRAALLTLIEALCCRIFCEAFLEKANRGKKTENLLFVLLFAGFLAISMLPSVHYFGKAVLAVLVIAVVASIQYENSLLKIFFVSACYYGMVLCIDRIMLIVISHVSGKEAGHLFADPVRGTVVALACKTVLFFAVVFLKKKFGTTGSLNLIEDKEWVRFLFFPMITVVCMLAFATEEHQSGKAVSVTSFALVFLNFLVFYMIQNVVEKEKSIREMQIARERAKNRMAMYAYMESVFEEQRKKTHEYKNQIGCLNGLLDNCAYEEAKQYIREIHDSWIEETDCVDSNNAIVNSILNQKYKQAKRAGITLLFFLNDLSGLPLGDEDIVILLGNLLDNAIEACEKIMEGEKVIKFYLKKEGSRITILVRNPVSGQPEASGGRLETSKSNLWEHGIGMSNIQSVVEKYGGESIWSCSKGYFTHSIVIKGTGEK